MAISAVGLYELLKPRLGDVEAKELLDYVDERIRGEVATKEDLQLMKADLEAKIREVEVHLQGGIAATKEDLKLLRAEFEAKIREVEVRLREEMWKLRVLIIVVLVLVVILNPKVLEFVGKVLSVTQ